MRKQISKKVLKCISKLDKELQYAVIDGLEKGGDDLVRAVKNLDDDAAELRIAVEDCLEQLRILYPDYNFSAVYGGW